MIYDGFKSALRAGVPKDRVGILVDEQFGAAMKRPGSHQEPGRELNSTG